MAGFVGAIDQGTTSTRCMIFDHEGREVARHQVEHRQLLPSPGRVEHDPMEILERAQVSVAGALRNASLQLRDLVALGVTNQRETTVVWDPSTGEPYLNAIVWQDLRSEAFMAKLAADGLSDLVRAKTGLPLATYFSAGKLRWALDHVPGLALAAARGRALFGTIETWLLWNLTGGPRGGRHLTDVTNASRTQLMDLRALEWDEELLALFGIPPEMLPPIVPSSGEFGEASFPEVGGGGRVPVRAALGDQHAAMLGQVCTRPGEAKNTYGTGNFLLVHTGGSPRASAHGLITTVCYQLAGSEPQYALEGSIAVTGAVVQWLRDQLGLISSAAEVEPLAAGVPGTGGVYFVPAFSGLFAPYWRADARGLVVGLTRATTKAHLARAALEAICFQTRDVLQAMEQDVGTRFGCLKVDGGVTANALCMQLQADIAGLPVSKPAVAETTALGAAYAAGLAVGFWPGLDELRDMWAEEHRWEPQWEETEREQAYDGWLRAVQQALSWGSGPSDGLGEPSR